MWTRYGNIWFYNEMPIVTVEPFQVTWPIGSPKSYLWKACCGGRPVEQIKPGTNSAEVMRRAEQYYDARIEMEAIKERW